MMEAEGYVDRITFRNEENGYTVLYLSDPSKEKEEEKETCCVGSFSIILKVSAPNFLTILAASAGPIPFIAPDPKYLSVANSSSGVFSS